MWNLKNQKLMSWNMSDDPVFMKLLKDMAFEIHMLREDVQRLQNIVEEKKTKGRFLTMNEACGYIHKSRATMQKWIADGKIDFAVKNGGTYLFPEDKLKAYASGMV